MKKFTKQDILKIKKTAIGFCALALVIPVIETSIGFYQDDPKTVNNGLFHAALCGLGLSISTIAYLEDPNRKDRR